MKLLGNKALKEAVSGEIFRVVSECATELNQPVYVIGGYVRDLFLERPSKDIDFVIAGSGVELAELVAKKLNADNLSVFKNFGTAMIKHKAYELEFVGARKESYNRNSRKPIVEDGTLEEDQERRDFTINAMAISLNQENYGELVDPFNGLKDLEAKILKTPLDPSITFSDDPLRMMRAVRFASQLNFNVAPEVFDSIISNKKRIEIISQERITEELNKMILSQHPSKGFKILFKTGLLHLIFPEMAALQGVDVVNGRGHKDNFYHTLGVLDNILPHTQSLWLRWAAILHDIAKPPTKKYLPKQGWTFHGHEDKGARMIPGIFKRMKLPLDAKMKYVQKLVRLHLRPIALTKEEITDSALRRILFEAGEDIDDLMTLCKADITSKNEEKVRRFRANFEKVEQKLKEVEEKDKLRNWQPPISGEVIIKTFNLKPNKIIGDIKLAIREAILDGKIENTYEAAFEFMLEKGKELNLEAVEN
ncbi:MAG: CCA tRNA nucleotidyltransferase [Flavobacteriales bacterium]|nr:CCA tRNA nucleotidyltransferase [Flavobacteriales bacterium]